MKTKSLLFFLSITFTIGWLSMGLAAIYGYQSNGRLWLLLAMWAPLLSAVVASHETRSQLWSRIKRAGWWFWPMAVLVGWSFSAGQQGLLYVLHHGHWNADMFQLSMDGGGIESIHHGHMLLGVGRQGFAYFALNMMLSMLLGSLLLMLIGAIGEEAGWRGVLQPEMERRFGVFKGTLLVGLIWGYWHLPINLMGLNDTQHPVLGSLVIFPLLAISMSFVLAWLVRRSSSVWPAALAHGANNTILSGLLILPDDWFMDQWTAIACAIVIGALFAWLLARDRTQIRTIDSRAN